MEKREVYQKMASKLQAIQNCEAKHDSEWRGRHEADLLDMVKEHMPRGSGCDSGTHLLMQESTPEKLVFQCDFHHMNDGGYYDGWTEHKVIITPSLGFDFNVRVTGRDRNQIKDYLAELFT
jgi:hypothetical protein